MQYIVLFDLISYSDFMFRIKTSDIKSEQRFDVSMSSLSSSKYMLTCLLQF